MRKTVSLVLAICGTLLLLLLFSGWVLLIIAERTERNERATLGASE